MTSLSPKADIIEKGSTGEIAQMGYFMDPLGHGHDAQARNSARILTSTVVARLKRGDCGEYLLYPREVGGDLLTPAVQPKHWQCA